MPIAMAITMGMDTMEQDMPPRTIVARYPRFAGQHRLLLLD